MIRGVRWQRGPDPGGVVPGKVQGNVLRPYGYPVSTLLRPTEDLDRDPHALPVQHQYRTTIANYSSTGTLVWNALCDGAFALGCGGILAASNRVLEQLLPGTIYLACAEVIGVLAGLGIGFVLIHSRLGCRVPVDRRRLMACIGLAAFGVMLPVMFPFIVQAELWLNATVSSTSLLLVARGFLAGMVTMPIGLTAAACLAGEGMRIAGSAHEPGHGRIRSWLICGTVGYAILAPAGEWGLGPAEALVGLVWWTAIVALARLEFCHAMPAGWLGRGVLIPGLSRRWRRLPSIGTAATCRGRGCCSIRTCLSGTAWGTARHSSIARRGKARRHGSSSARHLDDLEIWRPTIAFSVRPIPPRWRTSSKASTRRPFP